MAKILILDGHSAAALALTRSLGRAGHWTAVGANQDIFAPAIFSRYCRAALRYPVSTDDAEKFVMAVVDFVRRHAIDLLIPATDWTTFPISCFRSSFEGLCRVALPSHEALLLCNDKYQTVSLAQSIGIPVPETWLVHSLEDLDRLHGHSFPLVVKDRFSVRWLAQKTVFGAVKYAYTKNELQNIVAERLEQAGDVLVQSFAPGVGIGFSCFCLPGEVRLPFQWQRIREVDPRGSGSSARKSIPLDKQVLDWSTQLMIRAGFEGIAMVEYKRNADQLVLMEVNARPWGSLQLPIVAGINYPLYLAGWYLERTLPPTDVSYTTGITCRRLVGELTHLMNVRRGKPEKWPGPYPNFWSTLFKVGVPWYPGMRYDELSLSDPRPGLAALADWFGTRLRRKSK